MALLSHSLLFHKLDEHFPVKSVKFSAKDKKWMTGELKKLDRQRKREWVKNGKSIRYSELKAKFDQKYKDAAAKYSEKNVADLLNADPGKAYATIKRIGAKPGDDLDDASFDVLEHLERKLSSKESVNLLLIILAKSAKNFQQYLGQRCHILYIKNLKIFHYQVYQLYHDGQLRKL